MGGERGRMTERGDNGRERKRSEEDRKNTKKRVNNTYCTVLYTVQYVTKRGRGGKERILKKIKPAT